MEDPTLTLKRSKISTQKHGTLLKFGFSRIHTAKVIQTLSLSPVYQLSLALVRKTGGKGKEPGASRLQCNKGTTSSSLGGFTSPPPSPHPHPHPKLQTVLFRLFTGCCSSPSHYTVANAHTGFSQLSHTTVLHLDLINIFILSISSLSVHTIYDQQLQQRDHLLPGSWTVLSVSCCTFHLHDMVDKFQLFQLTRYNWA